MIRLHIDPGRPDSAAIEEAARVIRTGGVVAFPTETVYGLGANALDPAAIGRVYAAKGRPAYNPLIVHCASRAEARQLSREWPDAAERLARKYWPGPLTLVVQKHEIVPGEVTAGLPTVALRVPDHPVALALMRASGTPIAAPSANPYSELSPTRADHVIKTLGDRIDLILDGGPTQVGIESTVVDVSGPEPLLLRPGTIDRTEIEAVLGRPVGSPTAFAGEVPRPAPGMVTRHYSPRAEVQLFPSQDTTAFLAAARERSGRRVAALLLQASPLAEVEQTIRMPTDAAAYAHQLYATLHQLDDEGYDVVLVESPPATPDWAGVLDRLRRAAAFA